MNNRSLVLTRHEAVKRHVLGLKEMSRAGTSTKLPIAEIAIGERLIPEDPRVVAQLVTSIRRTRQVTPILVRRNSVGYTLIDGLNRIAALNQLDEIEVFATILDLTSDQEAKACEAISNSHRRQKLTALDRALTDFAFLQYIENKVSQVATPPGGRQPKEKFHRKTAQELGVSPDQIARSCKIVRLDPYVQLQVRKRNLEDNQSLLLEIAAAGDEVHAQIHTLTRILNRIKAASAAPKSPEGTLEKTEKGRKSPSPPPPQSDSSEPSIQAGSNSTGEVSRPVASNKGETVRTPVAPPPHTQSTSRAELPASGFEAIKREWEKGEALLSLLRVATQKEQSRFRDECVMPILSLLCR
jgi:ParB-like chromosome segregation protein Spo0J